MTEKELHRLKRHDLLQLLLAQGREAAQLQAQINDMTAELEDLQDTNNRFIERLNEKDAQIEKLKERLNEKDVRTDKFKERLNEKDAQIEKLKERLNEKDAQIEKLKGRLDQKDEEISALEQEREEYRSGRIFEMDEILSLTAVGQKLEGIFISAQKAVEEYLEGVQKKAEMETLKPCFSETDSPEWYDAEEEDDEEIPLRLYDIDIDEDAEENMEGVKTEDVSAEEIEMEGMSMEDVSTEDMNMADMNMDDVKWTT